MLVKDDQLEAACRFVTLYHAHSDSSPDVLVDLLAFAGPVLSGRQGGLLKVVDAFPISVVVELEDEAVEEGGEEDEEDERVSQGRAVAGVVVARAAPFRDTVFVEELRGSVAVRGIRGGRWQEGGGMRSRGRCSSVRSTHVVSLSSFRRTKDLRDDTEPCETFLDVLDTRVLIRTCGSALFDTMTYCNSNDFFRYALLISPREAEGSMLRCE